MTRPEPQNRPLTPDTDPVAELDEAELDLALAEDDHEMQVRLRQLLDPGELINQRTAQDVDRALRGQGILGAASDLLATGWLAARLILTDEAHQPTGTTKDDGHGTS